MSELIGRDANGRFVAGNHSLGGRPPGARNRFSGQFVADIAASWEQHGPAVLQRIIVEDPAKYADLCSRLIPRDVTMSVEQRGAALDEIDLSILRAIKEGISDAGARTPSDVFAEVLSAIREYRQKLVEANRAGG
jgi:hypothetical protein